MNRYAFIDKALNQRREDRRFRSLRSLNPTYGTGAFVTVDGRECINFSSNDYLGLSGDPRIIDQARNYLSRYGSGSTASRLICGTYDIHLQLEEQLAQEFDQEAALVFNTGFQANSSIIATLANRNSLILSDKRSHNSLLQGAMLSRARFIRFAHNDLADLEHNLVKAQEEKYERIIIVTESVFSMDGDSPDVDALVDLSEAYGAFLFVDEAHAIGVWGEQGRGMTYGLPGIDMRLGTFGKALGSFGAFVLCPSKVKDYLINFCPGFIYTTALPPAVIGANEAALTLMSELESDRRRLQQNTNYLRKELARMGFDTGPSTSQIIPVIIGSEDKTLQLQDFMEEKGILATAIRPPTVAEGKSRIRITLSSRHRKKHVNKFLQLLNEWKQR